jgi:hypothetical protein
MPSLDADLINAAAHVTPLNLAILLLGVLALAVVGLAALIVRRGPKR